jgi:hypothetical protein
MRSLQEVNTYKADRVHPSVRLSACYVTKTEVIAMKFGAGVCSKCTQIILDRICQIHENEVEFHRFKKGISYKKTVRDVIYSSH